MFSLSTLFLQELIMSTFPASEGYCTVRIIFSSCRDFIFFFLLISIFISLWQKDAATLFLFSFAINSFSRTTSFKTTTQLPSYYLLFYQFYSLIFFNHGYYYTIQHHIYLPRISSLNLQHVCQQQSSMFVFCFQFFNNFKNNTVYNSLYIIFPFLWSSLRCYKKTRAYFHVKNINSMLFNFNKVIFIQI